MQTVIWRIFQYGFTKISVAFFTIHFLYLLKNELTISLYFSQAFASRKNKKNICSFSRNKFVGSPFGFLFQAYLCPWRGSRLQIGRNSSWQAWAASWRRGGGTPSGCPSPAAWSEAPPAAANRARIWNSSWRRHSSHDGAARSHSKLTERAGVRRASLNIFSAKKLCEPTASNYKVYNPPDGPKIFIVKWCFLLCVHARMFHTMIMLPCLWCAKSLNAKLWMPHICPQSALRQSKTNKLSKVTQF